MSTSHSPSMSGIWECRNCRTKNVRRLQRCALCDCINPDSISSPGETSGGSGTGPRSHIRPVGDEWAKSTRAASPLARPLIQVSYFSPPAGLNDDVGVSGRVSGGRVSSLRPQSPSNRQRSFERDTATAGLRSAERTPRAHSTSATSRHSPTNSQDRHLQRHTHIDDDVRAQLFRVADQHKTASQLESLQIQLQHAVASHRALMQEYAALNVQCDRQESIIDRLRGDVRLLDELYRQAKDDHAALLATVHQERSLRQSTGEALESQCAALKAELEEQRRTHEASIASLNAALEAQRNAGAASEAERLAEVSFLRKELADEVQRHVAASQSLQEELDEERRLHHAWKSSVEDQVVSATALQKRLATTERDELSEIAERNAHFLAEAEESHQAAERSWAAAKAEMQLQLEEVTRLRDGLVDDAQQYLALLAELQADKAQLKSEVAALQAAATVASRKTHDATGLAAVQPQPPTLTDDAAVPPGAATYRLRLERFFAWYLPERLGQVDVVLDMNRGQEETMFATLVAKCGPEPNDIDTLIAFLSQMRSDLNARDGKISALEEALRLTKEEAAANAAAAAAAAVPPPTSEDRREVESLMDEMAALRDALQRALERSDDLDQERSSAQRQRDALEEQLAEANELHRQRTEALQKVLTEQQQENIRLVEELDAMKLAVVDMEQTLADAIVAAMPAHDGGLPS